MSGHSKWSQIKHKKAIIDSKRGRLFTKLVKEISVAARQGGSDPDGNPRLRTAIDTARSNNMPADNIDRAVKKGAGELEGQEFFDVIYEGYAPHGVALLVQVLTDNKMRTQPELRTLFSKKGGAMGEAGSVSWMFERKGLIVVLKEGRSEDQLMEWVLDAGAEDLKVEDESYEIITDIAHFEDVKKALREHKVTWESAELSMIPKTPMALKDVQQVKAVMAFMEAIEDHDDVQHVYSNLDIDTDMWAQLEE